MTAQNETVSGQDAADRAALGQVLKIPVRVGLAILLVFSAVFFVWGAAAPLEAGAIAPGKISPEGSRRTVQHLEGGLIETILVRNGDVVAAGEPLIELRPVQARANVEILEGRRFLLAAQLARLRAEQAGRSRLDFPDALRSEVAAHADGEAILAGEALLFERRTDLFARRTSVLRERIGQLEEKITGLEDQIAAQARRRAILDEEIEGIAALVEDGLAPRPRLQALQREQALIDEQRAGLVAAIAETRKQIGETEVQLQAMQAERLEETAAQASAVQSELLEVIRQLDAGTDVLQRTVITAPIAGEVTNLAYKTEGGVISPGAPILDIVPAGEPLVIEARLSPLDVDSVWPGQTASVHFSALPQRGLPRIEGEVIAVSADAIADEHTGETHFQVRVSVAPDTLASLGIEHELTPGMPAEIIVVTGARTLLDYLVAPIRDSMRHAMKES